MFFFADSSMQGDFLCWMNLQWYFEDVLPEAIIGVIEEYILEGIQFSGEFENGAIEECFFGDDDELYVRCRPTKIVGGYFPCVAPISNCECYKLPFEKFSLSDNAYTLKRESLWYHVAAFLGILHALMLLYSA